MIRCIPVLSLLFPFSAWPFEVPGLELVYTAPVETKLEAADLRNPAEVWVEMIEGAKKTIVFGQMYAISKPGEPLEKVLAAIEAAGERGVRIRFLLETKMLRASDDATIERLRRVKNLELRIFDFGKLGTDGIVHAKYFVVDGRQAFVGSQNFDWRALKHIHETGLRVSDASIVGEIAAIFESDWRNSGLLAAGKKVPRKQVSHPKAPPAGKAYLVASPPSMLPSGVRSSEDELIRLIGLAKEDLRVQLLDYSASYRDKSYYGVIDQALRAAAARGVKVKLMVSHWNSEKPGIDYLKSLAVLPNVEVRLVTIPRAKEGKIPYARVNHSKIMTVDGKLAWVGTSNWSGGYLDRLRNLEIVSPDAALAQRLASLHEQLWSSEYSARLDLLKEYPKPDKGLD